jgi:predicted ATPase
LLREAIGDEQLVTLTGIGGAGKTRLALEVAAEVLDDYEDGVFFVDLSAVSDPAMVGQTLAAAAGLAVLDTTGEGLAEYFAGRCVLVVLDNCEHLLDACADLIEALLARGSAVRVLATSREALGVEGEKVLPVPSLDIESDAVALFAERARSQRPEMRVDSSGRATVAEICRRLDGIPLAIELAAAQTGHLGPQEILDRLQDRFRILVGGRRRIGRQQTLTAAMDWSFGLLGDDEQLLLRRLAVFRGSFPLQAAEAVCHPDASSLIRSLVAKSLISLSDDAQGARYRLGESVRLYAEDKLAQAGEAEQLRSAHRDWYLDWIESQPVAELTRLDGSPAIPPEADNLSAALEWSRQEGRWDLCCRIATRMVGYWTSFFLSGEMATWGRELDVGVPPDSEHRAAALLVGCGSAFYFGEWDEVDARSAQVVEMAPPDSWLAWRAWNMQGAYWSMRDPQRCDDSFEMVRDLEDSLGLAPDLSNWFGYYQSHLRRALNDEEALAVLRQYQADHGGAAPHPFLVASLALYGDT